jgi:hypothetical protein
MIYMNISMCNAKEFQNTRISLYIYREYISYLWTADGGKLVKVLCYKSEGRWFDSRWCHWHFSLT